MTIFLELIDTPVSGECAVTGQKVDYQGGYGFFAEGKLESPVAESEALKTGFTMSTAALQRLSALIQAGVKFEEVQKAAHEEFANWRAL